MGGNKESLRGEGNLQTEKREGFVKMGRRIILEYESRE